MTPTLHSKMARFKKYLHPVNTVKNIVDGVFLGSAAATNREIDIVDVVNDYTGVNATVPIGATVRSFYLFFQTISTGTGTSNHDWYIIKDPGGQLSVPVPGATGGSLNRKWIIHEEKGLPGNDSDGAYPLTFKGVIKIPRHMQRCGEGDKIMIVHRSADISNICVKAIYKFIR